MFTFRFNLDDSGRVPNNIITIDSDEDEDPDAKKRVLSQSEMDFFSCLKVKPNQLNRAQEETFDLLAGFKLPLSERKANSIHSLFDRLRGHQSKSAARIRLIDFYRKQKIKVRAKNSRFKNRHGIRRVVTAHADTNESSPANTPGGEPNKENVKTSLSSGVSRKEKYRLYRIANDNVTEVGADNAATETNSPSSIEQSNAATPSVATFSASNGLYRVVENSSVDKRQNNKIVMKIAKPVEIKESRLNGLTEHSLLLDGYSPARDIPIIEDHVTAKCNHIRSTCKNLPQNPLAWTKHHVADFIQAADCAKYARKFLEEVLYMFIFL